MCCVQLFIEGGGKGTKIQPLTLHIIHSLTSSITVLPSPSHLSQLPPHLFPSAILPYPPCTLIHIPPATLLPVKFCSPHVPKPTNSSQIPHVTNKCSTSSPAPLSHIAQLSSKIILHLILSSNNPAEPVLSERGGGVLHHLLPKFEHIFVAITTFSSFLLCRYFSNKLVAYCVCFKMMCELSL